MDFLFYLFFLVLASLFFGIGFWKRSALNVLVGAFCFLAIGLLLMSSGMESYSGSVTSQAFNKSLAGVGYINYCFNYSTDYYNSSGNLTSFVNTTTCVCSENQSLTEARNTTAVASYARLPRDFEMGFAVVLMLVSFYLMYLAFDELSAKKGEY